MREICLDTETTGLDPKDGHRIVEIGCVEIFNKVRTGKTFHCHINPKRDMPEEAFKIHGISGEFLQDKPEFDAAAAEFMEFVKDAKLVIHNAAFDMKFINHHLRQCNIEIIERRFVVDSLEVARNKFPGAGNSLDALCKRFGVDSSRRVKHGALLDAELLADVYIELMGGAQMSMFDDENNISLVEKTPKIAPETKSTASSKTQHQKRNFVVKDEDLTAHKKFILDNFEEDNLWEYQN